MKGAIFDMDGLLFDTERLFRDGWGELAKKFGQVPNPDFPAAVAGTSAEGMREVIRRFYPKVDAHAFQDSCYRRVEEIILRDGPPEKPGMREILTFFRERGVKTAVASSSSRKMILQNFRSAGVEPLFDVIVGGEDVTRSKPEPDIFLLAAQRMGLAPEDCYVFEDGINGARAGIAAGCATVMVLDLYAPTHDVTVGCAGIYESLLDAKKAIENGTI